MVDKNEGSEGLGVCKVENAASQAVQVSNLELKDKK